MDEIIKSICSFVYQAFVVAAGVTLSLWFWDCISKEEKK